MTSANVLDSSLDPDRVPIGLDAFSDWVELRFTGIENPHILIVGGSQAGKTTLQILIAAVAASRGCVVIIIDPKLRFSRAFRHPKTREPLPHVLVYRDADSALASREFQGALELVIAEQQQRYRADDSASADILHDHTRFPNVLVVIDEMGKMLDESDDEWLDRRPDDYKGKTPVRKLCHTLVRAGAEGRIVGCFANQTASEQELPAGTRTRNLCGQRIFIGPVREGVHWRMLAGEGISPPAVPDGQKGAASIIFGDGKPRRFQVGFIDWKKYPERIYALAARGLPILRRDGHVDDQDRLILAGVRVPRPGEMASHVAGPFLDLLRESPAWQDDPADDEVDTPAAPVDDHAAGPDLSENPAVDLVIGLQDGADFCGMSVANFRKIRSLHPIEGEIPNALGNKPGWPKPELRLWMMRHGDGRARNDRKEWA